MEGDPPKSEVSVPGTILLVATVGVAIVLILAPLSRLRRR